MPRNQLGFVTEAQIREEVRRAFEARLQEDEERAKEAKEQGHEYKRRMHPALFETAEYKKWIDDRLDDARRRGLLVTDQQLADVKVGRKLQEGDRARFVGQSRIEPTRSGRNYTRPHGQTGFITQVTKGHDGLNVYLFMPDYPKEALEEGGPDVFVAQFQFKERTPGYFEVERIPEKNEQRETPRVNA